jgi:hypothetical protein
VVTVDVADADVIEMGADRLRATITVAFVGNVDAGKSSVGVNVFDTLCCLLTRG